MLDDAGLTTCKIVASNSLDEDIILALIRQGAAVDMFGVGERMITAKSTPVFGGVYKLCAKELKDGRIRLKLKLVKMPPKIHPIRITKKFIDCLTGKTGKLLQIILRFLTKLWTKAVRSSCLTRISHGSGKW